MAHCGGMGNQRIPEDLHDIRGTIVRGPEGQKLGKVNDVIFDHDTMEIRYLVVDSDGSLEVGTFLLPADSVSADRKHNSGLSTSASKQQIENAPEYDKKSLRSKADWDRYEQEFKKYWEENQVMKRWGAADHFARPQEPAPNQTRSVAQTSHRSTDLEINPAELFPERMTN